MKLRTIHSAKLKKGTHVLLRADFDVALDHGKILDPFRIHENIPTLRLLLKKKCKIRIVSHLGRPHGERVRGLTLKPVARYLERVLNRDIVFIANPFQAAAYKRFSDSTDIVFFENVRFWPGEEKGSPSFARMLARWGDVYVNEAFANSHRNHASMALLPTILPSFAGLHCAAEVANLSRVLDRPRRPLVAILSGAKLETKLPLIRRFLRKQGTVLIGGVLANTLLRARGFSVGKSPTDRKFKNYKSLGRKKSILLPVDGILARSQDSRPRTAVIEDVKKDEIIFDIGPKTIDRYSEIIRRARTIIWNGPLGRAEIKNFSWGTRLLAKAIQRSRAFTVIGGGDTLAVLSKYELRFGFDHVSTGGGAMLEFLSGKKLTALQVLKK